MPRRRASQRLVLSLAFASVAAVSFAVPAFASDADSGTPLTVTITDGSTPSPSSSSPSTGSGPASGASLGGSSTGGARGAGGSAGIGGSTGTGTSSDQGTTPAGQTTPANEVSAGGGLFVSGLNGDGMPAINPADGTVDMWFTVRNASTKPVDAAADFWMEGTVFSNRLDSRDDVPIAALQPGETRTVAATLSGAGQWTLVSAHVTFTPPETDDAASSTSVTRDALVLVFPWLLVLVAMATALALAIVRVVRTALPRVPTAVAS
ncbi:hypothetical protein J2X55_002545 [Microbacterium sp. 1154]|uniref:hypothetical protein n=1 Tax=Microbacterium sp. 1154 TaxID=2817733 RepID=UPI000E3A7227|nr:hypothetical protein [Microbacterium sp. 1154]MDR6691622.1 hypothetical protein [Microbacterium sp. 1154]